MRKNIILSAWVPHCWQFSFQQITDKFESVLNQHFYNMRHTMLILHVHGVTFLSGDGGDCGGLMAGWDKPETTVQEYVLTFVNEQELDIFEKTSGHFSAMFVATKSGKRTHDPLTLCVLVTKPSRKYTVSIFIVAIGLDVIALEGDV